MAQTKSKAKLNAKLSVKRGDNVLVIAGKDAGKQGKVIECFPSKNRISVEGVNIISKHKKPRSAQDHGGIIKKEGTIDVSNVMIVCDKCGKPSRIKHQIVDGKSIRVCKCGATLERKYEKQVVTKKSVKETAKKPDVKGETKESSSAKKAKKTEKATSANTKAEKVVSKVKRDV